MKRSPLRRRSRLSPVSPKRVAIRDERREFVAQVLATRRWCEACPILHGPYGEVRPASDVHELVRRSQGSPIVPSQGLELGDVLAVCRGCHHWIGDNPAEAVRLGLARWGMRQ